jgi:hypothetical protein
VAHDPEAVPLVIGTDGGSRDTVPLHVIPALGQVSENGSKVFVSKEAWNVLQQDVAGSHLANALQGFRPEVPVVPVPLALPGDGKGLAGEARREDVNHALIASGVPVTEECADIAEDRGFFEESVLNPLREDFLAVFIDLHVAYGFPSQKFGP